MNCYIPRKSSVGLSFKDETKCQRHLAKMTDINYIMQRALGGDSSVFRHGEFMDVSECPETMQEMLNCQRRAIEAYEMLPDEVRKRYTSPQVFLDAASTPEGRKEFVKFGLAFEKSEAGPIEVRVINPVTPKGAESSNDSACA